MRQQRDAARAAQGQAQAELAGQETRFKAIFDQAAIGIERVSLRDGRLLEVNAQLCRMLDYPRDELLNKTFADITYPPDFPMEQRLLDQLLAREIPFYAYEKRYLRRDGSPVWVRVTSSLARWGGKDEFRISMIEDITEQRQAQESLRHTLDMYRLIVENARDFALVTMDLESRFTSWNIGAQRVYGWKGPEILGQKADTIFTPEDRAQGIPQQEIRQAMETGYASDERWHVRKDGSRFYFAGSVWPIYDETGSAAGFAKVGTDISNRKRLEDELAKAKGELEQAVARRTAELTETVQQLESFSYSLSHDMRAPLRAIRSYADIVKMTYGEAIPAEGRELLDKVAHSAQRMDALIRDVLTYHRTVREPVRLHPVETGRVLDETLDAWTDLESARGAITVERPLLRVIGHEALLMQCLSNLIGNALRFVPPGRKPKVRIWTEPRDGQVLLWIQDNGIGIRREDQEKIWEMFRVLDPEQYGGTGIGLAIVRKAAQRMNGSAGVESEPGQGSRFWLQLPAA